jgi:hypothetical protein
LLGASSRTEGHRMARPGLGTAVMFRMGNSVPPPSSTSFK